MSESVPFAPRPRAARRHAPSFDVDNFLHELNVITHRVERVAAVPVEAFSADCPEYDSACMSMDDQLLWTAVTRNVPDMIERLRAAASHG